MIEKWNELIGKRILLRQKYLTSTSITEVTVVEVSESSKYVKFKWQSGSESWEEPEDEYSFNYDKIVEVLGPTPASKEIETEEKSEKEKAYLQDMRERAQVAVVNDQTIHITFPEEISEEESEIYNGGIYETLKPNECYLITKIDDRLLVATNKDGKIEVEYVSVAHEDDAMTSIHTIGAGRAIGAGINTLLKMLSEQEGKKSSDVVPAEEKEPDIVSNPLTGGIEPHDDSTSAPKSKLDTSSIK